MQEVFFLIRGSRYDIGNLGSALGERPGLVKTDGLNAGNSFQHRRRFEKEAAVKADATAHHNRRRGSQPQSTGTSDHQNRDGCRKGKNKSAVQGPIPDKESDQSQGYHRRDKIVGNEIGQALDRRFNPLGFFHHLDNTGKHCVFTRPGGSDLNAAGTINGSSDHRVTDALVDWNRLPGQHGFVDAGLSRNDFPIHRYSFSGFDQNHIADFKVGRSDFSFFPIDQQTRLIGLKFQQAF